MPTDTAKDQKFKVHVESHCIGCSTCEQLCGAVFAMGSGSMDAQKSYVKADADLEGNEQDVDIAVQMCPVTAIVKTPQS